MFRVQLKRLSLISLPVQVVLLFGTGFGQVSPLVDQGRVAVREALENQLAPSPDQGLWREALNFGRQAYDQAPHDLIVLRFMGRLHSYMHWHFRAWNFWTAYFAAGGTLSDAENIAAPEISSEVLFAKTGVGLGFARYTAGQFEEALEVYLTTLEHLPENREALTWTARIYFELGQPPFGLPYWDRLIVMDPDDGGIHYYLGRVQERLAFGLEASDAFQAGLVAYDQGLQGEALGWFEFAAVANGDFKLALVWAGRTSLELHRPSRALGHWSQVLKLDASDRRAAYFRDVSEAQVSWGIEVAEAYYRGQELYEQGELEGAVEKFEIAMRRRPELLEAWVGLAKSLQDLGRTSEAIVYWLELLDRDSENEEAAFFLDMAQKQLVYGVDAGRAFTQALMAYQVADLHSAEASFLEAIQSNPDFTAAYGWLGRIYFAQAEYLEAERYYKFAAELEPDNEGYRYFMKEALRLIR